jgi:hypothetical protein
VKIYIARDGREAAPQSKYVKSFEQLEGSERHSVWMVNLFHPRHRLCPIRGLLVDYGEQVEVELSYDDDEFGGWEVTRRWKLSDDGEKGVE